MRNDAPQEIIEQIIEQLRKVLPPIFLGSSIDDLTGNAIRWATTQNKRSRREIPAECFVRSGPRVLVVRDTFLDWWATTLQSAQQTAERYAPQPARRPNAAQHLEDQPANPNPFGDPIGDLAGEP